jgi:hypothetical protein
VLALVERQAALRTVGGKEHLLSGRQEIYRAIDPVVDAIGLHRCPSSGLLEDE